MIYMPMIPEALFAMLACTRIGAIHSVVFGGFAAAELSNRFDDMQPKLIVTASCGIEPKGALNYTHMIDHALHLSKAEQTKILIVQRHEVMPVDNLNEHYYDYHHEMFKCEGRADPVFVEGEHPIYTIYTSGTTGQPKGIVRDTGGTVVALNWSMDKIFDIHAGETFWAASDIGWVLGHSYMIYGPLIRGATTVMYEGKPIGTPDAGAFWRLVSEHKVKGMYVAPTAIRILKQMDFKGEMIKKHDVSCLKMIHIAGERCDPDTIAWMADKFPGVFLNDNWWQTETGWPICSNYANLNKFPTKPGSCTKPTPGFDVRILGGDHDDHENFGKEMETGQLGTVAIKLPMPPSFMLTLWNNDEFFKKYYLSEFPDYYCTGDAGMFDEDGYLHIMT